MEKKIKITISETGAVTVAASGYKGSSCLEATEFIEKAIGSVTKRQKTSDFYKQGEATDRIHNG
jgi:hypothetical protein